MQNAGYAQHTDTLSLPVVEITDTRTVIFHGGISTTLSDTTQLAGIPLQSLSELLTSKSAVFIKTYGSGGTATISSRGTEARHNAVLWNGINLNSSSLGLSDLSLIPSGIAENIYLVHGGSSSINGNSAIGSIVSLENSAPVFTRSNSTSLNAETGSYGNIHGALSTKWSNKNFESKTILFYDAADNNFEYINFTRREKPVTRQSHASFTNYGFIQDLHFKIKPGHILSAGIWYQDTEKNLPPLMTTFESKAIQRDSTWRTYISYKWIMKKNLVTVKGAYFNEYQYYEDKKYGFYNSYAIQNYFGEVEWRWYPLKNVIVNTGIGYNKSEASFEEYSGTRTRNVTSLFTGLQYKISNSWQASFNLRKEITDIANPPLAPSLAVEGTLYKNVINFLASAGRNYSLPAMNDLYWHPGGNPELKPESGWSEEASLIFFKKHKTLPALTVTVFNSVIDNWIRWQPFSGGIYTPDNLRQVHARGLETSVNYFKKLNKISFNFTFNYAWSRSTTSQVTHAAENATLDKQLMYVPEHNFNSNISIAIKSFLVNINYSRTGERFTTSDNSTMLHPYSVTDLAIEKKFNRLLLPFAFYLKVMNVFDNTYQVLAYRPMPGRWYSAGIKINFKLPVNKNKSQL